MKSVPQLEQAIEALESRNAFQDDIIEQLSEELAAHQASIAELKQQLRLLAERIKSPAEPDDGKIEIEPPPPHY